MVAQPLGPHPWKDPGGADLGRPRSNHHLPTGLNARNTTTTTVASQGLFLMNSEITLAAGADLAARLLEDRSLGDDTERSAALYSIILGRQPQEFESRRCLEFLQSAEVIARPPALRWQALAHVLLLSNEFLHLR